MSVCVADPVALHLPMFKQKTKGSSLSVLEEETKREVSESLGLFQQLDSHSKAMDQINVNAHHHRPFSLIFAKGNNSWENFVK